MARFGLSANRLAVCSRAGASLGEATLILAKQVGENCGSDLYLYAIQFGNGLDSERIEEQIEEIRSALRQALDHIPLGTEMLKNPEIMEHLHTAAEAAMLGRYDALVRTA